MQWLGGAKAFVVTEELRTKIIEVYTSGCSVKTTHLTCVAFASNLTENAVERTLRSSGVMRNLRQLKGARIKPAYRTMIRCAHCRNEFKCYSGRHVFCDECAPEGKFSKYIRKYGVSKREFDLMVSNQKCLCAICDKRLDMGKDTHVDHDHITLAVRGLLCSVCNTRLGVLEDLQFTDRANEYLAMCNDYRNNGRLSQDV